MLSYLYPYLMGDISEELQGEAPKMTSLDKKKQKLGVLGWREWVALPELGIEKIKAKVDTGARTSTLHAFSLNPFHENGKNKIRFDMHPRQHNTRKVITCVPMWSIFAG